MARLSILLFSVVLVPGLACAEDYAGLLNEAIRRVTWHYPAAWAYTETRSGADGVEIGRYDPSAPEGLQWTLLSVDGRKPTAEELQDYAAERSGDSGFFNSDGEDNDDPAAVVSPGTLTLLEETAAHWLLGFEPRGDDEEEARFMKKMAGTVRIAKQGRHLEYLDISARKPVSPKLGVKIREFNTRFEFARAIEGGPVVPVAFRFRIKGRAFLAVSFDEMETVEFSDFESVSD